MSGERARSRRLAIAALVALALPCAGATRAGDDASRAAMGIASAAYLVNALVGAHLAIRDSLPEAPFGMRSTRSVSREFYLGTGTALSPGLPMLVTQAVSTVLAFQTGNTAKVGATLLALHGAGFFIGGLSEPEVYRVLRHPRRAGLVKFAVVIGEIAIPPVMAIEAAGVRRSL